MPKPTEYDKTHLRNMAAIGTRIDRIFKRAAEEAAKIGVSIKKTLPEDRIFSFDDYPETRKQIERLMIALQESMETTIVSGVRSAWTLSNNKNNALVSHIFGDRVGDLSKEQYRRYFSTNGAALDAFIGRKEHGLNLSDRVWRYTNAFKHEIELGLDLGIRTGESAASMTRSLRQYLQHPDKLFRRVRDKHGNLRLSKAAQAFRPGRGVYRSSYKNARRLACTETNMAYRTSDHLRWQQMDFVVGIEIKLSNNHTLNGVPLTDICDELQGRYPKDFKFVGWHPHCRCFAVPIMKTKEEMQQDTQRILDGEKPEKGSVNEIKALPAAFAGWVEEHADRIEMGGNLPYFVRDNKRLVDKVLGISTEPQKTLIERAAERHADRKPEEIEKLQARWNEHRIENLRQSIADGYLSKEVQDVLDELRTLNTPENFEQVQSRIDFLQARAKKHMERTPKDIQDIKDAWEDRTKKARIVANNVLKVAQDYAEVDYSRLQAFIANGDAGAMRIEARKVAQAIKTMRDRENALSDLIPDVHEWHRQFSMSELLSAHSAIEKTFNRWTWDYTSEKSLDFLHSKLVDEISFVSSSAHKTCEIAKNAYKKRLALVELKQEVLALSKQYDDLIAFKTKSAYFNNWMTKAKAALDADDPKTASNYLASAKWKKESLEYQAKKKAEKAGKTASTTTTSTLPKQKDHPTRYKSDQERIDQIKDMLGCTEEQAKAYKMAVESFSYEWDWEIRQVQCGNTKFKSMYGHDLADIKKRAKDLEEFIEKSPQWAGGTTYRGMSLSDQELANTLGKLKAGTFHNFGSASWSTEQRISKSFSCSHIGEYSSEFGDKKTNRVVLVIKKPKHATSIKHLSEFVRENEVLASARNRYKFVKKYSSTDSYGCTYTYIEVEAI